MNSTFFDWLRRFSLFISYAHNRKVVFLLDSPSAHGNSYRFPRLSNVEILFLTPNSTAKLQLMDAGTIACLKRGYRKWQYEMAIDNLNSNVWNIYKVDQLVAMKVFKAVWQKLSVLTLQNCWNSTGLTSSDHQNSTVHSEDEDINGFVETLVRAPSRMFLAELFKF